jgi:hypothetical protein
MRNEFQNKRAQHNNSVLESCGGGGVGTNLSTL